MMNQDTATKNNSLGGGQTPRGYSINKDKTFKANNFGYVQAQIGAMTLARIHKDTTTKNNALVGEQTPRGYSINEDKTFKANNFGYVQAQIGAMTPAYGQQTNQPHLPSYVNQSIPPLQYKTLTTNTWRQNHVNMFILSNFYQAPY